MVRDDRMLDKTKHTSIELSEMRRAMDVWLTSVPMVAWGGLVVPIVPVAVTPAAKEDCALTEEPAARARRVRGIDIRNVWVVVVVLGKG